MHVSSNNPKAFAYKKAAESVAALNTRLPYKQEDLKKLRGVSDAIATRIKGIMSQQIPHSPKKTRKRMFKDLIEGLDPALQKKALEGLTNALKQGSDAMLSKAKKAHLASVERTRIKSNKVSSLRKLNKKQLQDIATCQLAASTNGLPHGLKKQMEQYILSSQKDQQNTKNLMIQADSELSKEKAMEIALNCQHRQARIQKQKVTGILNNLK